MQACFLMQAAKAGVQFLTVDLSREQQTAADDKQDGLSIRLSTGDVLGPASALLLRQQVCKAMAPADAPMLIAKL